MSKRRKIAAALAATSVIAVIAAVVMFLSRINQPVSGVITVKDSPTKTGYNVNLNPKQITGKHLSFDYPSGLTPQKTDPVTAPNAETFKFSAHDVMTWLLSVNVSTTKGDSLNADSGFSYRLANPDTYQESQITINNQTVEIMTDKTASFSKVGYILHGPLLATVSLYGDDAQGTQPLQTSFMMVLNSLRWL